MLAIHFSITGRYTLTEEGTRDREPVANWSAVKQSAIMSQRARKSVSYPCSKDQYPLIACSQTTLLCEDLIELFT